MRSPARRKGRLGAALGASVALHVLVAAWLLPRVPVVRVRAEPPPMQIVAVDRSELRFPARATSGAPVAAGSARPARAATPKPGIASTSSDPGAAPGSPGGETNAAVPDPDLGAWLSADRDRARRESLESRTSIVPWSGAHGTPGGSVSPTDALDGVGRLGSGERGDPRIPGSGGLDVAAVLASDAAVLQAQERAARGQVHPFLGEVKERVERCWLPVRADAESVPGEMVFDPVCAKKFHLRREVGKVRAIYDEKGARIAFEFHTGRDGAAAALARRIRERVRAAFDEAGMEAVPPELLDADGLLRLAWNVYIDDYRGCNQIGRGANAHKPGGDEILGIVELDGVY